MACINPNSPEFKEALKRTGNALLAELEVDSLVKPGVEELFDSNPELANNVYEALGFKQKQYASKLEEIANRRKLATKEDLEKSQLIKDIRVDKSQPKDLKPNKADLDLTAIMLFGKRYDEIVDIYRGRFDAYGEPLDDIPDGELEAKTLAYRILNDLLFNLDEINEYILEIVENPEYAAALTTNENPVKEFFENDIFKQVEKSKLEITPQQKQQALQQYSVYLDSIFPDSKVKDVVYHGSKTDLRLYNGKVIDSVYIMSDPDERGYSDLVETLSSKEWKSLPKVKFEKFSEREHRYAGMNTFLGTGHYFTTSKKNAEKYADQNLYSAIINVKNPYTEGKGYSNSRSGKGSQELIDKGYDAVTEKINGGQEYNVFEPEQIHILGSKQDLEGFKKFLNKLNSEVKESISNEEIANIYYSKLVPKISFQEFVQNSRYIADTLLRLGIPKSEVLDSLKCK